MTTEKWDTSNVKWALVPAASWLLPPAACIASRPALGVTFGP